MQVSVFGAQEIGIVLGKLGTRDMLSESSPYFQPSKIRRGFPRDNNAANGGRPPFILFFKNRSYFGIF
jgi:hypothetical protein